MNQKTIKILMLFYLLVPLDNAIANDSQNPEQQFKDSLVYIGKKARQCMLDLQKTSHRIKLLLKLPRSVLMHAKICHKTKYV